jgi:hypothetical protein
MIKKIALCFFFLINQLLFSQCPVGDVYLNNQTAVDDYIANFSDCEIINGNLYIGDATDISGITAIKRIEGSLKITYSEIVSVSNFSNLEFVGGDFADRQIILSTHEQMLSTYIRYKFKKFNIDSLRIDLSKTSNIADA